MKSESEPPSNDNNNIKKDISLKTSSIRKDGEDEKKAL
jgi:hypothetical protein